MLPEAIEAMTAQMAKVGNASSLHTSGRLGRRVVEESREAIAQALAPTPMASERTPGKRICLMAIQFPGFDSPYDCTATNRSPLRDIPHHRVML